jgi:hypothetical protein
MFFPNFLLQSVGDGVVAKRQGAALTGEKSLRILGQAGKLGLQWASILSAEALIDVGGNAGKS